MDAKQTYKAAWQDFRIDKNNGEYDTNYVDLYHRYGDLLTEIESEWLARARPFIGWTSRTRYNEWRRSVEKAVCDRLGIAYYDDIPF